MMDIVTLALAKKYTDETMKGTGSIQGKNCTIQKIENDDENKVSKVTFAWQENDGTTKTSVMTVPYGVDGKDGKDGADGKDGENGKDGADGNDGKSVKSATINASKHLILTLSDDTTIDAGLIPEQTVDLSDYVQKETGKGLSTNDYDNDSKSKVDAIPTNPKYTDTVYDDTEIKAEISRKELEITELKMLGWTVPSECPIKNTVSGNTFTQRVGRVDLGALNWGINAYAAPTAFSLHENIDLPDLVSVADNKDTQIRCYSPNYECDSASKVTGTSRTYTFCVITGKRLYVRADVSTTDELKAELKGKYIYYELATPITKVIDGNEAVAQINDRLDDYYLTNKAKWNQGTINYSSGAIVASTTAVYSDEIPCKEGDLITTKNMDNSGSENIIVVYYNASGFVSSERAKTSYTVPSNVTKFRVNYRKTGDVNTNARVYVNNAIDVIKNNSQPVRLGQFNSSSQADLSESIKNFSYINIIGIKTSGTEIVTEIAPVTFLINGYKYNIGNTDSTFACKDISASVSMNGLSSVRVYGIR